MEKVTLQHGLCYHRKGGVKNLFLKCKRSNTPPLLLLSDGLEMLKVGTQGCISIRLISAV